jgi:hypothetical protein
MIGLVKLLTLIHSQSPALTRRIMLRIQGRTYQRNPVPPAALAMIATKSPQPRPLADAVTAAQLSNAVLPPQSF